MRFSFEQAKNITLRATYETLVYSAEYETFGAEEIQGRVHEHFSPGYVRRLLRILAEEKLIELDQYDESSPIHYTLTDEGLRAAEDILPLKQIFSSEIIAAPASDRLVPLNHNSPEYAEISEALDLAIEKAQQTKPNEVSGDEHRSLVAGLQSARALWDAFELTKIQIEVGILMALERAQSALKESFQLVKGPLLVEAIKAFFKSATDGDLF